MKNTKEQLDKLRKIVYLNDEEKWNQLLILLDSNGEKFGGQEIRFVSEMGIPLVSSWAKRNQAYIQAYNKRGIWSDMPQPWQMITLDDLVICITEYVNHIEAWKILSNNIDEFKELKINENV